MDKKIVHIIDGLGSGGAERLLTLYAIELHQTGNNIHVVVMNERDGNPEQLNIEAAGIPTTLMPVGKLRNFLQIKRFLAELNALKPDVIHAHLQFASILGAIYGRFASVPCVATIHTLESGELANRDGLRRWLMYKVLELLSDRVICLSEAAATFARTHGLARARIEVLPNGIDLSAFEARSDSARSATRDTLGIADSAPLIITVAVLRAPKGIDRLIRAMPRIAKSTSRVRLLVVGDGSERERLVSLAAELRVSDRVIFAGKRNDVPDLMAAADMFVLPTLDDAQPTVVMEAMASRLPVVASRVGGIPDMIEDGVDGVLVPPDDVPALENAVIEILSDPVAAKNLAAAGRRKVEKDFSMKRQVAKLTRLYDTLLEDTRRA